MSKTHAPDATTGETVSYNYDALSRLTAASSSSGWGMGWEYDGWGNRTEQVQLPGKTGIAVTTPVDAGTNRLLGGYTHDAAGQVTGMPHARGTMEVRYDAAGRTSGAGAFVLYWAGIYGYQWRQTWGESYVYGPDGRRVYKKDVTTGEERYFLWMGVELLGEYRPVRDATGVFAGWEQMNAPSETFPFTPYKDRVGSNVYQQKYYPYGEAQQTAATYTFATYSRDLGTGLDYAQQRYYSSTVGRFTTPDPYMASGGVANPASWNRYSYVGGDPVNHNDPSGLCTEGCWDPITKTLTGCTDGPDALASYTYQMAIWSQPWNPWIHWNAQIAMMAAQARANSALVAKQAEDFARVNGALSAIMAEALRNVSDACYRAFAARGVSANDLVTLSQKVRFYDATTSLGMLTGHRIGATGEFNTLGSLRFGADAYVPRRRDGVLTAAIVVRQGFYGADGVRPPQEQQTTLIHELLHIAFQRMDTDLHRHLGVPSRFGNEASPALTDWLTNGCPQ